MGNNNQPLTDAELAEARKNHAALKAAYAKDPEATMDALRAAVEEIRAENK